MTRSDPCPESPRSLLAAAAAVGFWLRTAGNDTTSSGPVERSPGHAVPRSRDGRAPSQRHRHRRHRHGPGHATGVTSFFGAAFRIDYDNHGAALQRDVGCTASFPARGASRATMPLFHRGFHSHAGEVVITATRINPDVAPPVAVTATSDLVILTFVAQEAIAPPRPIGRLEFAGPRQVCDGTTTPTGCGAVTVTWSGRSLRPVGCAHERTPARVALMHIVAAVVAGGATIFSRLALIPALSDCRTPSEAASGEAINGRWRVVVADLHHPPSGQRDRELHPLSGPGPQGQALYHACSGSSSWRRWGVPSWVRRCTGRSAALAPIRANARLYAGISSALVLVILLISGVLRNIPPAI